MNKTQFSYIMVLSESNEYKTLSSDIYFPIILYIFSLLKKENKQYYRFVDFAETIRREIGISMPIDIVKNMVFTIAKKNEIEIEKYKDDSFRIVSWNDDIESKLVLFKRVDSAENKLEILEKEFYNYLNDNGIGSERTIIDLINDYADDITAFFNNDTKTSRIDENYVHLCRFFSSLKKKNKDLYEFVDGNLLYSTVIAGYLQQNKIDENQKFKSKANSRYFFDTSFVMNLLDLGTDEGKIYCKEVFEYVKNAGIKPYIHAITIAEIRDILNLVINYKRPLPGKPIEDAWVRREFNEVKLLLERSRLIDNILNSGFCIYPAEYEKLKADDIDIEKYIKTDNNITKARQFENKTVEERNAEIYDIEVDEYDEKQKTPRRRYLYDAFISNFIIEQNKNGVKSYLVTANQGLVDYIRSNFKKNGEYFIFQNKVTIELWLFTSHRKSQKDPVLLTEMINRCISLNEYDYKSRISSLYKWNNYGTITEEEFKLIEESVLERDAETIKRIDGLTEKDVESLSKEVLRNIVVAAKESVYNRRIIIERDKEENEKLQKQLEEEKYEKKELQMTINLSNEDIEKLSRSCSEQKDVILDLKYKNENITKENESLHKVNENQKNELSLRRKIDDLSSKINEIIVKKESIIQNNIWKHRWFLFVFWSFLIFALLGTFGKYLLKQYNDYMTIVSTMEDSNSNNKENKVPTDNSSKEDNEGSRQFNLGFLWFLVFNGISLLGNISISKLKDYEWWKHIPAYWFKFEKEKFKEALIDCKNPELKNKLSELEASRKEVQKQLDEIKYSN